MKKLVLLLCCVLPFSCSNTEVKPEDERSYDFAAVDTFLSAHLADYNDGVVVLVSQNGKLIYKKEMGLSQSDIRPIASASKWLSAGVILALVDEGKLSLDDSVGKFLPIFTEHHKGSITVRQMFSHTAGFDGDSPQKYEYRRTMTLAEAVDSIATYTDLPYSPGTSFDYGSSGMHIAGRIAELVSGKSWQALFNEKIGIPCQMTARYGSITNPIIAGGVRTNAENYLHFLEMILDKGMYHGRRVLSEEAVATMLQDQTNAASIDHTPYPTNPYSDFPEKAVRYGVGNWLDVTDASGNVLESSSPGLFGTHPWQDSKNHIAGIIFTQTQPKKSNLSSLQVRKLIRYIVEK